MEIKKKLPSDKTALSNLSHAKMNLARKTFKVNFLRIRVLINSTQNLKPWTFYCQPGVMKKSRIKKTVN